MDGLDWRTGQTGRYVRLDQTADGRLGLVQTSDCSTGYRMVLILQAGGGRLTSSFGSNRLATDYLGRPRKNL